MPAAKCLNGRIIRYDIFQGFKLFGRGLWRERIKYDNKDDDNEERCQQA